MSEVDEIMTADRLRREPTTWWSVATGTDPLMDRRPGIRGDMTFRQWIRTATTEENRAVRYLWAEQQAYLSIDLDFEFIRRYDGRLYDQPVLVIHEYGYVNSVKVGDCLGCAVGTVPRVVKVVAMPTRKRLRFQVIEGPRVENTFEWKRDLLLPFWTDGRQGRLF
jgi:hypothetical protein